jgi:transcription initiation factor TFIIH subunit 4
MASSIYDYLEHQESDNLLELYDSPWCCVAVFQSLPTMARHIVMRLLMVRSPVAVAFIRCWYKESPPVVQELDAALAKLKRLFILGRPPGERILALGLNGSEETEEALSINLIFAEKLQAAMASVEEAPWQDITAAIPPMLAPPSSAAVERVAGAKWNAILHFLIGTSDAPMPDPAVVQLLVATGLLAPGPGADKSSNVGADATGVLTEDAPTSRKRQRTGGVVMSWDDIVSQGGGEVHVTHAGYGFLLHSTSSQLWTFLDEYVRTASGREQKTTDILALLLELGFTRRGEGYAVAALTETQQRLLQDFAAFGLVHLPEEQELVLPDGETIESYEGIDTRRFFPTHLAVTLARPEASREVAADAGSVGAPPSSIAGALSAGADAADAASGGALQLYVEANFKAYAYTRAGLHMTLLSLYAAIECLLPNMVVATLTRRSVMAAYDRGITAAQVIEFLRVHLHPTMRALGRGVPENVAGQLILWQRERHRVAFRGAVLITGFASVAAFRDAVRYAKALREEEEEEAEEPTAGAGAGADKPLDSAAGAASAVSAELMDRTLRAALPEGAQGGLLWANEGKLQLVCREGRFAEALNAHLQSAS